MKFECERVAAFHKACDVPVRPYPDHPTKIEPEELALRIRLVREEVGELLAALTDSNSLVKIVDGIIDTMVVTAGTCVQLGAQPLVLDQDEAAKALIYAASLRLVDAIKARNFRGVQRAAAEMQVVCLGLSAVLRVPYQEAFEIVQGTNMAKVDPETGMVLKDEGGKVRKPSGWVGPEMALAELLGKTEEDRWR